MWERIWLTWALVESQLWANRSIISRVALGSYKFAIDLDIGLRMNYDHKLRLKSTHMGASLTPVEICDEFRPLFRWSHMLVTKIFEHGDMLDLKLWYCGYYVIDDGTHEVVAGRSVHYFERPAQRAISTMWMAIVCIGKNQISIASSWWVIPMCEVQYWMGKKMVCPINEKSRDADFISHDFVLNVLFDNRTPSRCTTFTP